MLFGKIKALVEYGVKTALIHQFRGYIECQRICILGSRLLNLFIRIPFHSIILCTASAKETQAKTKYEYSFHKYAFFHKDCNDYTPLC